jgi:hypothetical protein
MCVSRVEPDILQPQRCALSCAIATRTGSMSINVHPQSSKRQQIAMPQHIQIARHLLRPVGADNDSWLFSASSTKYIRAALSKLFR